MSRKATVQGAICLLLSVVLAPSAAAAPIDGFLDAGVPLLLGGDLNTLLPDPVILLQNPNNGLPAAPLVLSAAEVTLTRVTLDTDAIEGAGPLGGGVALPGEEVARETMTFRNATLEVSALRADADVLLVPSPTAGLAARLAAPATTASVDLLPSGVRVVDGFRKMYGEREAGEPDAFDFEHGVDGPLLALGSDAPLFVGGAAEAYVWSAHVLVRDGDGQTSSFQTGYEVQYDVTGAVRSEHYEYVLLELETLEATLRPGTLSARVLAPALSVQLDGEAVLPAARGTITSADAFYRAGGAEAVRLAGNLTLDVTPRLSTNARDLRTTVHLSGATDHVSLVPIRDEQGLLSTRLVAVSAGSAAVLGMAAWYLLSANGLVLAAPLARRRRPEPAASEETPSSPGELLFHSDRFTLYHLVESRTGLSASECARLTGIEESGQHLDHLAGAGLLVPIGEDPRRYALPGSLSERRAQRVVHLRDDRALFVLARLLVLHGLTPQKVLVQRALKVDGRLKAKMLPTTVGELLDLGLARREPGEEGLVVDPTDELYACLKVMGELAPAQAL